MAETERAPYAIVWTNDPLGRASNQVNDSIVQEIAQLVQKGIDTVVGQFNSAECACWHGKSQTIGEIRFPAYRPPKRVRLEGGLTIIAAMDCGDSLLIAADSLVTETGGIKITREKLSSRADVPLAWGFAGDEGIGLKFTDWLRAYPIHEHATWDSLGDAAIAELSRLNGRKRELLKLAQVEPKEDDLAVVLMAGYIGGVLDFRELTDRAHEASAKFKGFHAVGSGAPHAMIAYMALKSTLPKLEHGLDLMAHLAKFAALAAPMCGPPWYVVSITASGTTSRSG